MADPKNPATNAGVTQTFGIPPFQSAGGSATGAAGAIAPAIAAVSGKLNVLKGFIVTGAGATGASNITVTVTGLAIGTISFNIAVPAGTTTAITPLVVYFEDGLVASATNTAITLNVPSFGAGNLASAAVLWGYSLDA